jgi:uncharacterized protein YdeI (YjbR/CyaY-like superfamily)
MHKKISSGIVHNVPDDLLKVFKADFDILEIWESLTPIVRNEWICWIENAKKAETRTRRIQRLSSELQEGKKRPCCWPGCSHRKQ